MAREMSLFDFIEKEATLKIDNEGEKNGTNTVASRLETTQRKPKRKSVQRTSISNSKQQYASQSLFDEDNREIRERISRNRQTELGTNRNSGYQSDGDRIEDTRQRGELSDERPGNNGYGDIADERSGLVSDIQRDDFIDFHASEDIYIKGAKDKYRKNIEAIKIVKRLEFENTIANKEQQEIISQYTGWGGIPQAFDETKEEWKNEYQELKDILSEDEYNSAFMSILDSHYTPKIIIDTIYSGLDRLGLNATDDKKEILEPSAGNGAFLSFNSNDNYNFTCVEMDKMSSSFLKKLYPNQKVSNTPLEKFTAFHKFDAVIGNPPYGQKRIFDENRPEITSLSVHNYFMARTLDELKDNGIGAFVISSFVMDSENDTLREYINKNGTFLGAVRLPNNVFKNKAGTEVTTDIIFFKKGVDESLKQEWSGLVEMEGDIKINEYFYNNPQNVLGEIKKEMTSFGLQTQCVPTPRINVPERLKAFVNTLPQNVYKYTPLEVKENLLIIKRDENPKFYDKYLEQRVGTYCVINDEIFMKISSSEDDAIYFEKSNVNKLDKKRIMKIDEIRNTLNELINIEKQDILDDDKSLVDCREKLNTLYDNFVKKEGLFHRQANKKAFSQDIDAQKILALEIDYNKGISKSVASKNHIDAVEPSAKKADIFSKRTISPYKAPVITNSKEALLASLNLKGEIDLDYMSQELKQPKDEIANELLKDKLLFVDPSSLGAVSETSYILADKYLSGNVKRKLEIVKDYMKQYPNELVSNYDSLLEIQPKRLSASDIDVKLGTSWIPKEYYFQFFEKQFGINRDMFSLTYNKTSGSWLIGGNAYNIDSATISKYATERIGIFELAEHGLKSKPLIIRDKVDKLDDKGNPIKDDEGNVKQHFVVNHAETTKANAKLDKLKNEFADWIYQDIDRRTHLEDIYNDTFNTDVVPKYNGSHLDFSGLNLKYQLRPHQKNAIWRSISEKNVLVDHQVGAGKTLVAICSAMEQKRMGLVNKPMIVVPNYLISQWANEFYQAYPSANILVAQKKDLEKNNKEQFFAKIATNNYDAVIMTHTQFKALPSPFEVLKKQIDDDIFLLQEIMKEQEMEEKDKGKTSRNFSKKRTAKKISDLDAKLEQLVNSRKKSRAMDFSDLGVDALIVDESHEFKNLLISTSMGNISGLGNLNGSQRAYDMLTKTRYMHEKGLKINFLSGTPISNSITELYTLQRYLQPEKLEERDIQSFDAWASTFAQTTVNWELDTSANNYKLVTRLNKFVGVPELTKMYNSFADTITNQDIIKMNGDFLPKLDGDKPKNEISKRSENIANFIGVQDENGDYNYGSIIYRMEHTSKEDNMLSCTTDARKAGLDYRMIEPSADDYEGSKVNLVANNVFNEWKNWESDKGTQLVFCDLSTAKQHSQKVQLSQSTQVVDEEYININDEINEDGETVALSNDEMIAQNSNFDVYSDLLKKLVKKGVPQEQIRFIHDAKTDLQKFQLFKDVNAGKVRVLIGSTGKMGVGMNVQQRVTAIHHLDCPWRPADLEQRNGRVIRQGNLLFKKDPENFRIKEFRYATEKTYDARMWQVIQGKAESIEQFRMGGIKHRKLEDFSMGSADASEMKAVATGNPFILLQVQLSTELRQEEALQNSFNSDIYINENNLSSARSYLDYAKKELDKLSKLKNHLEENKLDDFQCKVYSYDSSDGTPQISDVTIYKGDNSDANKKRQESLKQTFMKNVQKMANNMEKEFTFFEYRGLKVTGERVKLRKVEFYLENEEKKILLTPDNMIYDIENDGMTIDFVNKIPFNGFFQKINNYFSEIDKKISKQQEKIEIQKRDIFALKKVTGENAPKNERKAYLEALRDDNNAILREIKLLSDDKEYVSKWKPKSKVEKKKLENKLLENRNKSHKKGKEIA